jgi:hypothetical protein
MFVESWCVQFEEPLSKCECLFSCINSHVVIERIVARLAEKRELRIHSAYERDQESSRGGNWRAETIRFCS